MIDWKTLGGKTNAIDGMHGFLNASGYDTWEEALTAYGASGSTTLDKYVDWLQSQTGLTHKVVIDLENYAMSNGVYTFASTDILLDGNKGITLNTADVSNWEDQIASEDVLQATASKQPAYDGGKITFVRADDQSLNSAGHIASLDYGTGAFTLIAVVSTSFDFTTAGLAGNIMNNGNTAGYSGFTIGIDGTANKFYFSRRQDGSGASHALCNSAGNDGNVHVIHGRWDGTTQNIYQDGVKQTDSNTTARNLNGTGSGQLCFGIPQAIGSFQYDGDLYQAAALNGAMTDDEILASANALLEKWS